MEMRRDEILENLAAVCRAFKGTYEQHQYLQASLRWLEEQLPKPPQVGSAEAGSPDV